MLYRSMTESDIESAVRLYIEYYNGKENGKWMERYMNLILMSFGKRSLNL